MAKRRSKMSPAQTTPPGSGLALSNAAVESALRTGEHARLLEDYFGEQMYGELRSLSAETSARAVRGGPRVFIVPGIMGSTLGLRNAFLFFDDVYWLDFIDTAAGKLIHLRLDNAAKGIEALGVFLIYYLKLKLRLCIAGYDADFWPFDWRLDIIQTGNALGRAIAESARPVNLVCHSMGGLVGRRAVKWLQGQTGSNGQALDQAKLGRIVMLGTPNFGSFAPIRAIRATHDVVRKVAFLDMVHTPEELSEKVFSTFPGLYQMLPSPDKYRSNSLDIFDAGAWPVTSAAIPPPRPLQPLLDAGKKVGTELAAGDGRFSLIAGVNIDTIVDVKIGASGDLEYGSSCEGDGTVPLMLAKLPGVSTYYIEEEHGALPNSGLAAKAAIDILAGGKTDRLPTQWSLPNCKAGRVEYRRDQLRDPYAVRDPSELRGIDRRHVLDGFLSIGARDSQSESVLQAASAVATAGQPLPGFSEDRIVIGRRRQRRLEIRLARGGITEADARALVLGVFYGVTPSGAARDVDARMRGALGDLLARRMFAGNVGETFILPVGRNYLRADFVVLMGLGTFERFTGEVQSLVAEHVVRVLSRTDVEDFALVLPGGSTESMPGESLGYLLDGILRGLTDADPDHRFRRVTLCEINPDRHALLRLKLYQLATTTLFDEVELTIDEVELPPAVSVEEGSRSIRWGADPCYLLVRQETASPAFRCSVLGAGGKAALLSSLREFDESALTAHLKKIESGTFSFGGLAEFGEGLAGLVLPEEIAIALRTQRDRHLVLVHDRPASRIPWETLCLDGWFPAAEAGMSRRYIAENLSVAKWLQERQRGDVLDILVVINPTGDLQGAEEEGDRLLALLKDIPNTRVDSLRRNQAGKPEVLARLRSSAYDLVHYAGHAFFDAANPSRSGILCAGEQVLSGAELASLGNLPLLMFFNACEAARIRRRGSKKVEALDIAKRIERNVGLAEGLLRGGVTSYIGTYWPVGDAAASAFAGVFYEALLRGETLGTALNRSRKAVYDLKSVDWCDYVLYGNPDLIVKSASVTSVPR